MKDENDKSLSEQAEYATKHEAEEELELLDEEEAEEESEEASEKKFG